MYLYSCSTTVKRETGFLPHWDYLTAVVSSLQIDFFGIQIQEVLMKYDALSELTQLSDVKELLMHLDGLEDD